MEKILDSGTRPTFQTQWIRGVERVVSCICIRLTRLRYVRVDAEELAGSRIVVAPDCDLASNESDESAGSRTKRWCCSVPHVQRSRPLGRVLSRRLRRLNLITSCLPRSLLNRAEPVSLTPFEVGAFIPGWVVSSRDRNPKRPTSRDTSTKRSGEHHDARKDSDKDETEANMERECTFRCTGDSERYKRQQRDRRNQKVCPKISNEPFGPRQAYFTFPV
jgi:hypothetical protein